MIIARIQRVVIRAIAVSSKLFSVCSRSWVDVTTMISAGWLGFAYSPTNEVEDKIDSEYLEEPTLLQ